MAKTNLLEIVLSRELDLKLKKEICLKLFCLIVYIKKDLFEVHYLDI